MLEALGLQVLHSGKSSERISLTCSVPPLPRPSRSVPFFHGLRLAPTDFGERCAMYGSQVSASCMQSLLMPFNVELFLTDWALPDDDIPRQSLFALRPLPLFRFLLLLRSLNFLIDFHVSVACLLRTPDGSASNPA